MCNQEMLENAYNQVPQATASDPIPQATASRPISWATAYDKKTIKIHKSPVGNKCPKTI
jgi:hypothetical protein